MIHKRNCNLLDDFDFEALNSTRPDDDAAFSYSLFYLITIHSKNERQQKLFQHNDSRQSFSFDLDMYSSGESLFNFLLFISHLLSLSLSLFFIISIVIKEVKFWGYTQGSEKSSSYDINVRIKFNLRHQRKLFFIVHMRQKRPFFMRRCDIHPHNS